MSTLLTIIHAHTFNAGMTKINNPLDDTKRRLKAATKSLIAKVGGQENCEHPVTRIKKHSTFSGYGNINEPDLYMPMDVVADLEKVAKAPIITKALAANAGYVLIPIQKKGQKRIWPQTFADITREVGEDLTKLAMAYANGNEITAAEIDELGLIKETEETMEVLAELQAHLIRTRDGEAE